MKRTAVALLSGVLSVFVVSTADAQPELPQLSPDASVMQQVGVTKFEITYSSPAVRGRKIWDGLVPYGESWRTGANAPTTLTADRDFTWGDTEVSAGSYRVVTIPKAKRWRFILNSDLTGGGGSHNPEADVAEATVDAQIAPHRERLAFFFENTTDAGTELVLVWDKRRVAVPIKVDTQAQVAASIEEAVGHAWRPHFDAARYLAREGNTERALQYYDKSIDIQPTWWALWFKAELVASEGDEKKALELAQRAKEIGQDDPIWKRAFADEAEAAMSGWKK